MVLGPGVRGVLLTASAVGHRTRTNLRARQEFRPPTRCVASRRPARDRAALPVSIRAGMNTFFGRELMQADRESGYRRHRLTGAVHHSVFQLLPSGRTRCSAPSPDRIAHARVITGRLQKSPSDGRRASCSRRHFRMLKADDRVKAACAAASLARNLTAAVWPKRRASTSSSCALRYCATPRQRARAGHHGDVGLHGAAAPAALHRWKLFSPALRQTRQWSHAEVVAEHLRSGETCWRCLIAGDARDVVAIPPRLRLFELAASRRPRASAPVRAACWVLA